MTKSDYNKKYYNQNTPYPIRLGDLKKKLHTEAVETGSSIHERITEIISDYYHKKEVKTDVWIQKLIEMAQTKRVRRMNCDIAQLKLFCES